jgi:uncharacterized protein YuzE
VKVTYDRSADAAYIYLVDKRARGRVARTYACDPSEVQGQIQLDFDEDGILLGIEVLDASHLLPRDLLG